MSNSHWKSNALTNYVIYLGECWISLEKCTCGSIHAYCILKKDPDPNIPHLKKEDIGPEMRAHILGKIKENQLKEKQGNLIKKVIAEKK